MSVSLDTLVRSLHTTQLALLAFSLYFGPHLPYIIFLTVIRRLLADIAFIQNIDDV